jgi:hypothetical protein
VAVVGRTLLRGAKDVAVDDVRDAVAGGGGGVARRPQ